MGGAGGGSQRRLIFITSGFKRTLVMMIHSIRGIRISLMGQTANMCACPPFHTWVFFPTPPAVPRRHSLRWGRAADTTAPVWMRRNICVGKREERSPPLRRAGCYLSEGPLCVPRTSGGRSEVTSWRRRQGLRACQRAGGRVRVEANSWPQ